MPKVMAGGADQERVGTPLFNVSVKDCVASGPEPLWAVSVREMTPTSPAARGVPEMVAVPLPLSTKVRPAGREPESEREGVGEPAVVMVKEVKTPTTKAEEFELVMEAGEPTARVAEAELPEPPLEEVTALVALVSEPEALAVTLREKVQVFETGIAAAERERLEEPATAEAVPPQVFESELGVATTRPAGSVSVKETPARDCVFAEGLVSVKVREVVALGAMLEAPKDSEMEGGASTARLAEAELPVPPSVEEMEAVRLGLAPGVVPVTLTEKLQEELAAMMPPEREMAVEPAVAEIVPEPQEPVRPLGVETTRPPGSESVKETPESAVVELAFEAEKVSEVEPPSGTLGAPKAFASEGGATTVKMAFEVLPAPPCVEVMETELFFWPAVEPATLRETVQEELVARVAAERLTLLEPATAVVVPVQVVVRLLGVATTRPEGKESVKATPVSARETLGLEIVKERVVEAFNGMFEAPKEVLMDGGVATVSVALAVLPLPPLVEATAAVVLT